MRSPRYMAEARNAGAHGAASFDPVSGTLGLSFQMDDGSILRLLLTPEAARFVVLALGENLQRAGCAVQSPQLDASHAA